MADIPLLSRMSASFTSGEQTGLPEYQPRISAHYRQHTPPLSCFRFSFRSLSRSGYRRPLPVRQTVPQNALYRASRSFRTRTFPDNWR